MIKVKNYLGKAVATVTLWFLLAQTALAAEDISEKTAEEVSGSFIALASSLAKPLGGALIFVSILYCGAKIVATANKPRERAEALGAIPYIFGGGLVIGGAIILAGFIMGMWTKL